MSASQKNCFIISPIGSDGSDTRKRSDVVLKYILTPPLIEAGYEVIRADKIDDPGMITSQVLDHIVNDDLVVADLTENNPNVFYELAIRHAVSKPFIQIVQTGSKIPFDISDLRTISVDHRDLESVENAKTQIAQQVEAINAEKFRVVTPLTFAVDLKSFESSGDKEEYYIANIMNEIAKMNTRFSDLEKGIESGLTRTPSRDRQGMMRAIKALENERDDLKEQVNKLSFIGIELDEEIPF